MNHWIRHLQVIAFLEEVCKPIKDKNVRDDVVSELENHLSELAELRIEQGANEEESISWAVRQMGDPLMIGKKMQQVYRPRVKWSLLGLLLVFMCIGLAAMYAIQLSYTGMGGRNFQNYPFAIRQGFFYIAGILVLPLLYVLDYRIIQRYSWIFYAGTLAIMAICVNSNYRINGKAVLGFGSWLWKMDFSSISPYLLVIALAGLHPFLLRSGFRNWCLQFALCFALPCLLFIKTPSIVSMITYIVGYITVLAILRISWMRIVSQLGLLVFAFMAWIFVFDFNRHVFQRVHGFFFPYSDPGASWQYVQTSLAVQSAGWWGRGFAAVNDRLPFIYAESVYPYLIYSLGWMMGIFIFVLAALWLVSLATTVKQIKSLSPTESCLSAGSLRFLPYSLFGISGWRSDCCQ